MLFVLQLLHWHPPKPTNPNLEIWAEPDTAGFPKNVRIPDFPEPKTSTNVLIKGKGKGAYSC